MPSDHVGKLMRMLSDMEINAEYNRNFRSAKNASNNNRSTIAGAYVLRFLWC